MLGRVIAALVVATSLAHADKSDDAVAPDNQVVLVNATAKLGDVGLIANVRRALSQRGLLFKLPDKLEATLDGRNLLIADLDAIMQIAQRHNLKVVEDCAHGHGGMRRNKGAGAGGEAGGGRCRAAGSGTRPVAD